MKKTRVLKIICVVIILAVLAGTLFGCQLGGGASRLFNSLMDQLVTVMFSGDGLSVNILLADPAKLELDNEDASLPLPMTDKDEYDENAKALKSVAQAFLSINYKRLTVSEKRDWEVVVDYFNRLSKYDGNYFYFQGPYLGANSGWNCMLPIYLDRMSLNRTKDIENYISLISQTYDAFTKYIAFEDACISAGYGRATVIFDGIAEQCDEFLSATDQATGEHYLAALFREKIAGCDFLTEAQKQSYISRHDLALTTAMLPAYEMIKEAYSSVLKPLSLNDGYNQQGQSYYTNGKSYYELEFAANSGSSDTVAAALQKLGAAANAKSAESAAIAASLTSQGIDVDVEYEKLRATKDLSKSALESYYFALKTAYSADFPTLPSSIPDPEFRVVPDALKNSASPAAYFLSAIDSSSAPEVIYVNPDSSSGYLGFDIIAHEGIPGHMLQHAYFKTRGGHMLRSLISYSGYAEGWATYVQYYSAKYYDGDETQKQIYQLFCLQSEINLYMYNIIDIYINYYGYTRDQLYAILSESLEGTPEEVRESSDGIYDYLIGCPNAYTSYAYGLLMFRELRASSSKTDLQFHTAMLSAGEMPFDLLKKHI